MLLQALRSAGVAGSPACRHAERDGAVWARPWLDEPRERIEAYVRRHRLSHVDDESNDDPRFARSTAAPRVWPALAEAFPPGRGDARRGGGLGGAGERMPGRAGGGRFLAQVAGEAGLDLAAWRGLLGAAPRERAARAGCARSRGRPRPRRS